MILDSAFTHLLRCCNADALLGQALPLRPYANAQRPCTGSAAQSTQLRPLRDAVVIGLQARKQSTDSVTALKAAERALTDFEAASEAWQPTSRSLDAALRSMGDVENLFQVLQYETRALTLRIGELVGSTPQH
jgi:hypothetical protein